MNVTVDQKHSYVRSSWLLGVPLFIIFFISACQANDHKHENGPDPSAMPQAPIEVTFFTEPHSVVHVGEPINLIAEVTQEGQTVDDAELVRFEIWYEDHLVESDNQHDIIEAQFRGEGQYVLEYTFDKSGMYYVMYHVDARGFHAMTEHEVLVTEQE